MATVNASNFDATQLLRSSVRNFGALAIILSRHFCDFIDCPCLDLCCPMAAEIVTA